MEKIEEVPTADSGSDTEPLEQVQYDPEYNVIANERQHSEQPESISNTCVVEKVDSNVIPDSPDMCDNGILTDQNVIECDDERVVLGNLISNLKLDIDENKKIQKKLKKANTSLTHELKECKSILAETSRTLMKKKTVGIKRLLDDLEVTTTKLMLMVQRIQDPFKWDQQVVSEPVALRNFAKKTWIKTQYIWWLHQKCLCSNQNGNSPPITKVVKGVETTIALTIAEEKAQRRLELKARSTL
ncbi:hypothetical protein Tco_1099606 [Tanacetum coccineum]